MKPSPRSPEGALRATELATIGLVSVCLAAVILAFLAVLLVN